MRICLVGHAFHLKSKSNNFFLEILEGLGAVTEFHHSPDELGAESVGDIAARIASEKFDLYVFWQTETVAAKLALLVPDKRFLIIPMWDAAFSHPERWWQRLQSHQFISFSRALHETLQNAGLASQYFQYFVKPELATLPCGYLRSGFFWERRPAEQVNASLVARQAIRLGLKRLHVHAACDFPTDRSIQRARITQVKSMPIDVTTSTWFAKRSGLEEVASKAAFYFAPRRMEGIGMAVVEAMARGQIVIAPDASTMNEYIGHNSSGILYDPGNPLEIDWVEDGGIERLRAGVIARATRGYQRWLEDQERLRSVILGDTKRWSATDSAASFGNAVRRMAHQRAFQKAEAAKTI